MQRMRKEATALLGGALLLLNGQGVFGGSIGRPSDGPVFPVYAEHRVCCDVGERSLTLPKKARDLLSGAASVLSQLEQHSPLDEEGNTCIHTFGTASRQTDESGKQMPLEEKKYRYVAKRRSMEPGARLQCATIEFVSQDSKVPPSSSRLFGPAEVEYWASKRPNTTLKIGSAVVGKNLEVSGYHVDASRFFNAQNGFRTNRALIAHKDTLMQIITEERLALIVPPTVPRLEDVITFLEFATHTRAPSEAEVKTLIFEEQLESLMSEKHIRTLDLPKALEKLRQKMGNPEDSEWLSSVPMTVLLDWSGSVDRTDFSQSERHGSRFEKQDLRVDLAKLTEASNWVRDLGNYSKREKIEGDEDETFEEFEMWQAFRSPTTGGSRRKSVSRNSGSVSSFVTHEQIVDFLLVKAPLVVSKSRYADVKGRSKSRSRSKTVERGRSSNSSRVRATRQG